MTSFCRPLNGVLTLVAAVALCATASSVYADTITVRDAMGGENASGNPPGYYMTGTGGRPRVTFDGANYTSTYTGLFDFEVDYGSGWQDLQTYCLESTQDLGFGVYEDDPAGLDGYTLVQLRDIPEITNDEADYIEILWANAFEPTGVSQDEAASLQIVLWELFQDDGLDANSLTTGTFQIDPTYSGLEVAVYAQAQTWVAALTSEPPTWTASTPLHVLTHPTSQDLLTTVPEPASFVLLVVGLLSARRRIG